MIAGVLLDPVSGLVWERLHPKANLDHLGFIPSFLSERDPDDAVAQLDKNYRHGGGWFPFDRFTVASDFSTLSYPDDPPILAMFRTRLHGAETIYVYEAGWVLVLKPDGSHEIARMD